jgi:hypothetical protein
MKNYLTIQMWRFLLFLPIIHAITFNDAVADFSWNEFYSQYPNPLTSELLNRLEPVLETAPILHNVIPPPIHYDCTDPKYAHILTGKTLDHPRKIIDMFPFFTELDLLEIRLYELSGLVDQHVIYESTRTHRGRQKRLFYNKNRHRFNRFEDTIVHLVEDDSVHKGGKLEKCEHGDCWAINKKVWDTAWTKYVSAFSEDDNTIVISGDVDEIPSRQSVAHLKYCEAKSFPIAGNINMHMFSFDWLFECDHQASYSHPLQPYSLKFPNFDTFKNTRDRNGLLRDYGNLPSLPFNNGVHMTSFGGLPAIVYKYTSAAETNSKYINFFKDHFLRGDYTGMQKIIDQADLHDHWKHRYLSRQNAEEIEPIFLPWIIEANLLSYQHFFTQSC